MGDGAVDTVGGCAIVVDDETVAVVVVALLGFGMKNFRQSASFAVDVTAAVVLNQLLELRDPPEHCSEHFLWLFYLNSWEVAFLWEPLVQLEPSMQPASWRRAWLSGVLLLSI